MTLSTTQNVSEYTGDGSTTEFSFPYLFYANSHLKVYLNGTLKTITTHYNVTGAGVGAGGTVTFVTAPADDDEIVIQRVVPYDQQTDLENFDGNPADVTEKQLDLLVMMAQQIAEQIARALLLPVGSAISGLEIPEPVADNIIGWNAAATALENKIAADLDLALVSSFIETLLDDVDAATARATLGALGLTGGTLTGLLATIASATGGAGLRLPHGTAPTSPTNGDLWTTTAGMYARINGVTKQLGVALYKIGLFTRDISLSDGNVSVTGVGFQPDLLIVFGGVSSDQAVTFFGVSDGTTTLNLSNNNASAGGSYHVGTELMRLLLSGPQASLVALVSRDADGFTVSFTKSGSPTGTATINYLALKLS